MLKNKSHLGFQNHGNVVVIWNTEEECSDIDGKFWEHIHSAIYFAEKEVVSESQLSWDMKYHDIIDGRFWESENGALHFVLTSGWKRK